MKETLCNASSRAALWSCVQAATPVHAVVAIIGIGGNSLVILCVLRSAVNRTPINVCFANLAAADILVAVSTSAFVFLETLAPEFFQGWLCLGMLAFGTQTVFGSIFSVLVIGVKRWRQVVHWNSYHTIRDMKKTLAMIAGAWGFSTLMSATILLGGKPSHFARCRMEFYLADLHRNALGATALLGVVTNACFCLKLLHFAIKSRRAVHPHIQTAAALERARQLELRLTYTVIMVIAVLILVLVPLFGLSFMIHYFKDTPGLDSLIQVWGITLAIQINSAVNPFIYAWRSKAFRDAIMALLPARETLPCWRTRIINAELEMHVQHIWSRLNRVNGTLYHQMGKWNTGTSLLQPGTPLFCFQALL